jgi:RNA polymerase sigma factor (sigma-70 family)
MLDEQHKDYPHVRLLLEGNQAEWKSFVSQYTKLVYSAIHATLNRWGFDASEEDLEDVHWSVFSSLIENDHAKLRQFKGQGGCSLASWMRLIAVTKTHDFLRDRARSPNLVPFPETESGEEVELGDASVPSPIDEKIKESTSELLSKCISKLPPKDGLLLAYFSDGKSVSEIATIMSVSENNVYVMKHRCIKSLQECMKKATGSL